jgi:hypothetical protein
MKGPVLSSSSLLLHLTNPIHSMTDGVLMCTAPPHLTTPFPTHHTQTLNLILLTASELAELRTSLKDAFNTSGASHPGAAARETFVALFRSWCHNPVATFRYASACVWPASLPLSGHDAHTTG